LLECAVWNEEAVAGCRGVLILAQLLLIEGSGRRREERGQSMKAVLQQCSLQLLWVDCIGRIWEWVL